MDGANEKRRFACESVFRLQSDGIGENEPSRHETGSVGGTCQMASDQAGDEAAGGKNCAGIEAGFHPFCEDKAHSGQDSIAGHDGFTKAAAIHEGSDFGKSGYRGKRRCEDCFASVVVVPIFRLSGSAVFGETAIFRVS